MGLLRTRPFEFSRGGWHPSTKDWPPKTTGKQACVLPDCKGSGIYAIKHHGSWAYLCSEHRLEKNLDKRFPVKAE